MTDAERCDGCVHRHTCSEVYERLGHRRGPNVAMTSVVAFVLPIAVFIMVLGPVESLLSDSWGSTAATLAGVGAGLLAGAVCVAVGRRIRRIKK